MSSITTEQGSVHYEVFGRGKPVILLHGYQGSWGLWQQTMTYLAPYYRTYALDFWGFGESGTRNPTYAVQDFVGLVAPHALRPIVGPRARYLLPAAFLAGAVLVVVADAVGRSLSRSMDFPLGSLTALVGAPYFLFALRASEGRA